MSPTCACRTLCASPPARPYVRRTRGLAYADAEMEYAPGRYLMRPREIGKLLQAVKPARATRPWPSPRPMAPR